MPGGKSSAIPAGSENQSQIYSLETQIDDVGKDELCLAVPSCETAKSEGRIQHRIEHYTAQHQAKQSPLRNKLAQETCERKAEAPAKQNIECYEKVQHITQGNAKGKEFNVSKAGKAYT